MVSGQKVIRVSDGKVVRALTHSDIRGRITRTGSIMSADKKVVTTDPWVTTLMGVEFNAGRLLSVGDAAAGAIPVKKIRKVGEDAVIQFQIDTGYIEVTLSAAHNYLATTVAGWGNASSRDGRGEHRVMRMKQVTPGVFFPEEVEYTLFQGGQGRLYRRTRFTEIKVNSKVPRATFELPFPAAYFCRIGFGAKSTSPTNAASRLANRFR